MRKAWVLLPVVLLMGCKNKQTMIRAEENQLSGNRPAVAARMIIYKTVKDYSDYVPVTMNDSRTAIVSYPHPLDLFYQDKLAKPIRLKNGYWLDNRGIGKNVAFLRFTYEEYSKMKDAPGMQQLMSNLLDKYPLVELIYCGYRANDASDLERAMYLVDAKFPDCKPEAIETLQVTE